MQAHHLLRSSSIFTDQANNVVSPISMQLNDTHGLNLSPASHSIFFQKLGRSSLNLARLISASLPILAAFQNSPLNPVLS
jgi:hypothetical protein